MTLCNKHQHTVLDWSLVDLIEHLAFGDVRLTTVREQLTKVARTARRLPPWWPEATLIHKVFTDAWKTHGAAYRNIVQNAFSARGDGSVRMQDIDHAKTVAGRAGKKMAEAVRGPLGEVYGIIVRKGITHFQNNQTGVSKALSASEAWAEILAEREADLQTLFAEKFPEMQLHPKIVNLAEIMQKNPRSRGIDKDTILERMEAAAQSQKYWEGLGTVGVSRLWAGESLKLAQANGASSYRVQAVMDNATCSVCTQMHGHKFPVADAVETYDNLYKYLEVQQKNGDEVDLDEVRATFPFPREQNIDNRSPAEIASQLGGQAMPPYHPHCRCQVVFIGVPKGDIVMPGAEPPKRPRGPAIPKNPVKAPRGFFYDDELGEYMLNKKSFASKKAAQEWLEMNFAEIVDLKQCTVAQMNDNLGGIQTLLEHAPLNHQLEAFEFKRNLGSASAYRHHAGGGWLRMRPDLGAGNKNLVREYGRIWGLQNDERLAQAFGRKTFDRFGLEQLSEWNIPLGTDERFHEVFSYQFEQYMSGGVKVQNMHHDWKVFFDDAFPSLNFGQTNKSGLRLITKKTVEASVQYGEGLPENFIFNRFGLIDIAPPVMDAEQATQAGYNIARFIDAPSDVADRILKDCGGINKMLHENAPLERKVNVWKMDKRTRNGIAGEYSPTERSLWLNPKYTDPNDYHTRILPGTSEWETKEQYLEKLKDRLPGHSSRLYDSTAQGVQVHEYAHAWHDLNRTLVKDELGLTWNGKSVKSTWRVTTYAGSEQAECFAENFTVYFSGHVEVMDKDMVKFFDRHMPNLNFGGTNPMGRNVGAPPKVHVPRPTGVDHELKAKFENRTRQIFGDKKTLESNVFMEHYEAFSAKDAETLRKLWDSDEDFKVFQKLITGGRDELGEIGWAESANSDGAMWLKYMAKRLEKLPGEIKVYDDETPLNLRAALNALKKTAQKEGIDVSKALSDSGYLKLRAFNQAYMDKVFEGQDWITMYRGTGGYNANQMLEELSKLSPRSTQKLKFTENVLAGYTDSPAIGNRYGANAGGFTVQRDIHVKDVMLHPDLFSISGEREFIIRNQKKLLEFMPDKVRISNYQRPQVQKLLEKLGYKTLDEAEWKTIVRDLAPPKGAPAPPVEVPPKYTAKETDRIIAKVAEKLTGGTEIQRRSITQMAEFLSEVAPLEKQLYEVEIRSLDSGGRFVPDALKRIHINKNVSTDKVPVSFDKKGRPDFASRLGDNHMRGMVAHEYGHAWHLQNEKLVKQKFGFRFWNMGGRVEKAPGKYHLTQYASEDARETFAENFCAYMQGYTKGMHKDFVKFFDEQFPQLNFGGTA